MKSFTAIQIGELCLRLGVPYRDARYVLEEDLLPRGVESNPDRGNHRQLTPGQAFWLGMVLRLKASGVKTPLAAKIAHSAMVAVQTASRRFNWEHGFSPFQGELETNHQWFVEIADLRYIRLVTNAKRSQKGLFAFDWFRLGQRQASKRVRPLIVIRVDLAELGRLLASSTAVSNKPRHACGRAGCHMAR
jgi:hypothetical protein